jgi:hypothetical protein
VTDTAAKWEVDKAVDALGRVVVVRQLIDRSNCNPRLLGEVISTGEWMVTEEEDDPGISIEQSAFLKTRGAAKKLAALAGGEAMVRKVGRYLARRALANGDDGDLCEEERQRFKRASDAKEWVARGKRKVRSAH